MAFFTDQIGNTIQLDQKPKRIVSLVPSQTELLNDLGLFDAIAGISNFCIHPDNCFKSKPRIGGTKTLQLDKIKTLNPDLIIANKEENSREQVASLAKDYPVWTSDIHNLDTALEMISSIAALTQTVTAGQKIIGEITKKFLSLKPLARPVNCAYLIWRKPYMSIGGDTFISDILHRCGLKNVFGDRKRYPEISMADLQKNNCELLLLSSEPFPFADKHILEFEKALPNTTILLVDGEMFSWYGSRLIKAPAYFETLLQAIDSKF